MTIDELINIDFSHKSLIIIGRPSAGKTWLSSVLGGIYKHHEVIHTDNYLKLYEDVGRQIYAAFEDAAHYHQSIIEGCLGYQLLLEGVKRKCYSPDVVIEVEISAGKQREIYLKERNTSKIQYLKRFQLKCMCLIDDYFKLVPESEMPLWLTLNNEW